MKKSKIYSNKSNEEALDEKIYHHGLDAGIDRFNIYHSYPGQAVIRVVSPDTRIIKASPCSYISSPLDEGLTGELVYAGASGYKDYQNIKTNDKIVLADMTWVPPRLEKARIALEKKAKALIIMNWGTADNPFIQMGTIKSG